MQLYICLTYYHVLIAVIKTLINNSVVDLLISNDIPGFELLNRKLINSGLFHEVIEYDAQRIKVSPTTHKYFDILMRKARITRNFKNYFNLDLKEYTDIYIFQDVAEIGQYLIYKKIEYHLIEDALDYFKYFDKYYSLSKDSYNTNSIRYKIKKLLGVGCLSWGTTKYCKDIEVNDLEGIKISKEKVFEIPRRSLFDSLDNKQRIMIYNLFANGMEVYKNDRESVLICTQPLFEAGHVKSMDTQIKVFEEIIKLYQNKGYNIVIKPHPRDMADYSTIVKKYDCGYIDKNLPSEILNYNLDAKSYYAAVSITSTSINFLDCAKNKVFMGMEYVKRIENNM